MFAVRVDYLTGRVAGSAYNDRTRVEWPPHPIRLYAAFVDAWADADEPDPAEREALEWLASQPAPELAVGEACERPAVRHFVPVNDVSVVGDVADAREARDDATALVAGATDERARARAERARVAAEERYRAAIQRAVGAPAVVKEGAARAASRVLPQERLRQPREFPSAWLPDPTVHLVWPGADPQPHVRAALGRVAARVVRVGHSASLVACRLVEDPPRATLLPDEAGPAILRVPGPGVLAEMEAEWERRRGVEPRRTPARDHRYAPRAAEVVAAAAAGTFGEDWIVLRRVAGDRPPVTAGVAVAQAVRGALLRHADEPVAEILSGHAPSGAPTRAAHLAIVPVPDVGHEHASGRLLGVALVLPRQVSAGERRAVLRAVGRWEAAARAESGEDEADTPPLTVGVKGGPTVVLSRVEWGLPPSRGLRPAVWVKPATRWVSVTPVALDRNPGRLDDRDARRRARAMEEATASIRQACVRSGLPEPTSVELLDGPPLVGAEPVRRHPPFPPEAGRVRRVRIHVAIEFAVPVRGPVLLGAGRHYGLGLFRPLDEGGAR